MNTEPTIRLFLAVELDAPAHEAVADLLSRLQKAGLFTPARFNWVTEDSLQLTLYFLGETRTDDAVRLRDALTRRLAQVEPFEIDIRHIGYFPQETGQPPKVLWTSIYQPPEILTTLRDVCAEALRETGLPVPQQGFKPHITLARIKSAKGLREFQKVTQTYEFVKCGRSAVTGVTMMESVTGDGPATYRPYHVVPLQNCTR